MNSADHIEISRFSKPLVTLAVRWQGLDLGHAHDFWVGTSGLYFLTCIHESIGKKKYCTIIQQTSK